MYEAHQVFTMHEASLTSYYPAGTVLNDNTVIYVCSLTCELTLTTIAGKHFYYYHFPKEDPEF